jgi:hypothetical protein
MNHSSDNSGNSLWKQLVASLWEYKLWWGIPFLLMAALLIFLLVSTNLTGDSPFIYQLF